MRYCIVFSLLICLSGAIRADWQRDLSFPMQDATEVELVGHYLYISSFDTIYRKSSGIGPIEVLGTLGDSATVSKLLAVGSKIIAGTYDKGIYESLDGGFSWSQRNSGLTGPGANSVSCISSRGDSVYVGTSGAGIFVTSTSGEINWQPFRDGLPWNLAWDVYSLFQWNDILFTGAGQNGYVYRNVPDSNVWNDIRFNEHIGTGLAMLSFGSIASDILVGLGFNGIYDSRDSGVSWRFFPAPFNGATGGKLISSPDLTLAILSHPIQGIYMYEWNNDTWELWDHQTGLIAYDFEYYDGYIYAACWAGLWYYPLNPTGVDPHDPILPDRPSLAQNYPNPFNPMTTIEYVLPKKSHVTIDMYNVSGQKIRTLVDREESAGSHQVIWDGKTATGESVATGIYFYRFQTENLIETKKLMLLR